MRKGGKGVEIALFIKLKIIILATNRMTMMMMLQRINSLCCSRQALLKRFWPHYSASSWRLSFISWSRVQGGVAAGKLVACE